MAIIRRLVIAHPALFLMAFAAALLVRAFVPTGFMPESKVGRITIAICTGNGPIKSSIELPVGQRKSDGRPLHSDMVPCHFASLALPLLVGDLQPQVLDQAGNVRFVPAVRRATRALARPAHHRPPARAPPAILFSA